MLTKAVLATLAYYDVLDYPLKAEEVFNYLIKIRNGRAPLPDPPLPDPLPDNKGALYDPFEVRRELDQLVLERIVSFDEGYYFLFDREYLVPLRRKKAKLSARKLIRARRIICWLVWLPYMEAIFASGSLGLGNCDELSDLDVLVVARHGRIWTARLLITGFLSVFGLRRKPSQKIAPDKICLNHYITDQSLAIPFHGIYNAQTYLNLKPLLMRDPQIVEKFYLANAWLWDFIYPPAPQHHDIMIYHNIGVKPIRLRWPANLLRSVLNAVLSTFIGDWLERWAKKYQTRRITANPLTTHPVGHIVYDDTQLSFHPDSPEQAILKKYQALLTHFSV